MPSTNEWTTAPKDGSVFHVQFPDGTRTKARWNVTAKQWEAPRRGKWASMRDVHGGREPTSWWPENEEPALPADDHPAGSKMGKC
jgi:hypothetical protein